MKRVILKTKSNTFKKNVYSNHKFIESKNVSYG